MTLMGTAIISRVRGNVRCDARLFQYCAGLCGGADGESFMFCLIGVHFLGGDRPGDKRSIRMAATKKVAKAMGHYRLWQVAQHWTSESNRIVLLRGPR